MEPAAITSLNSVKVTVVSGACSCDFQLIQRGEVEDCHSQRRQLALAETLTRCECVSESSGLIDI